jgi:hypothetical protein
MFQDFCEHVCSDIEVNRIAVSDDNRIFIWDNLATHHFVYICTTITTRAGPHRFYIIPRPPYHTKFGPIEYRICDITQQIKLEAKPDWDIAELEQQIIALTMRIGLFDSTFLHCRYCW